MATWYPQNTPQKLEEQLGEYHCKVTYCCLFPLLLWEQWERTLASQVPQHGKAAQCHHFHHHRVAVAACVLEQGHHWQKKIQNGSEMLRSCDIC